MVIGSGIVGSALALCLAASNVRVAVIERSRHPRFALGESIVTTATGTMRRLAEWYGLPELRAVSHYPELRTLGLRAWPKSGFWFGFHREGVPLDLSAEAMLAAPGLPMGPDVHVVRSDVDAYLAAQLPRRGVSLLDNCRIRSATLSDAGWRLSLGSGRELRTRLVVDSAGEAVIAKEAGLTETVPRLATNTRALFGHFAGVPPLDAGLPPWQRPALSRDATTIHHCFDGGWIWVIRFDDGICSIGAVLDRSRHPDRGLTPDRELETLFGRFPTISAHLGQARAVGRVAGTGRLQRSRRSVIGHRIILAPTAVGFVDPLFSPGVDLGMAFVQRAVPRLVAMLEHREFESSGLEELARAHEAETSVVDRLVSGCYRVFGDASAAVQYWRFWIYSSLLQYVAVELSERDDAPIFRYGSSLPGWQRALDEAHRLTSEPVAGQALGPALAEIASRLDEPLTEDWSAAGSRTIYPEASRSVFDWARDVTRTDQQWDRLTSPERIAAFERRRSKYRAAVSQRAVTDAEFRLGLDLIAATASQARTHA